MTVPECPQSHRLHVVVAFNDIARILDRLVVNAFAVERLSFRQGLRRGVLVLDIAGHDTEKLEGLRQCDCKTGTWIVA